ncbi:hypothetical protein H0I76_15690 [Limibaculum sp. M0105]|uniref:Uncharacterized protein n=1 Tax=Thermohalobaculum xanthum TaxID=2753746 RepID=A0A8J7M968_9RHOB|nr:hypothetical protein [Thermohalobaculum xanthum]MBK0400641.1 hypothetical protein [Thermohalobaculum xanthum]
MSQNEPLGRAQEKITGAGRQVRTLTPEDVRALLRGVDLDYLDADEVKARRDARRERMRR